MSASAPLTPRPVPRLESNFRKIVTDFPVPESLPLLERLLHIEPRALHHHPPVVWHRAEGFQVYDPWGNQWLDWSSGVLTANAGHGRHEIIDAITRQAQSQLLTNYCFPSAIRAELCERIISLLPEPLRKVFLLSTGSETIEFAIKLARMHGHKAGGRGKNVIVSFQNAFHGRTLGAQQAGGNPALKGWIGNFDPGFVQVPFPDGYWTRETTFEVFARSLAEQGIAPSQVCAVLLETYQGATCAFAPPEYVATLRQWCDGHKALLVFDEVQAGLGRTGKLWGFQHYNTLPDLVTIGKGLASSLPISAIAGKPELMDLPAEGAASSTHTGNPVCCAAALASLDVIINDNLAANAAAVGKVLHDGLRAIQLKFPQIAFLAGKGLVAGLACIKPGGHQQPDEDLAQSVVWRCAEKGLLLTAPVGPSNCTIRIAPPLTITADAIRDGCQALDEAFTEVLDEREARLLATPAT